MSESHATKRMSIHFRWREDIGHIGLFESIVEALQKGDVLKEAGIITIEADSPDLSMSSLIVVTKENHTENKPFFSSEELEEMIIEEDDEERKPQI